MASATLAFIFLKIPSSVSSSEDEEEEEEELLLELDFLSFPFERDLPFSAISFLEGMKSVMFMRVFIRPCHPLLFTVQESFVDCNLRVQTQLDAQHVFILVSLRLQVISDGRQLPSLGSQLKTR